MGRFANTFLRHVSAGNAVAVDVVYVIALLAPVVAWYGLKVPTWLLWPYLGTGVFFDLRTIHVGSAKIRRGYGDSGEHVAQYWVYFWWTIGNPLSLSGPWQVVAFLLLVGFHLFCCEWVLGLVLRRHQAGGEPGG